MKPTIRELLLKRFRCVPGDQIEFGNPTLLVGRNGAGKSNLIDAFAFLAESMASPLQAVFDTRGGISMVRYRPGPRSYPGNLGLGVVLGEIGEHIERAHYAFEVKAVKNYGFEVAREQCIVWTRNEGGNKRSWFDRRGRKLGTNVSGLDPALSPESLAMPVVGGESTFEPVLRALSSMQVYSIDPAKLHEMQEPTAGPLRSDGSNASSVLKEIERQSGAREIDRICEILEKIVPSTERVRTIKHGKKLALEFTQRWGDGKHLKFESFSMSDGTLRALGLILAVSQRSRHSVVAIEEPEATIHPGALGVILDLLRDASRKTQLVVTTHSPEVLDAEWIEDKHLRIVSWCEGATRVSAISEGARQALQQHLMGAGELMRSNALHPVTPSSDTPQVELFRDIS